VMRYDVTACKVNDVFPSQEDRVQILLVPLFVKRKSLIGKMMILNLTIMKKLEIFKICLICEVLCKIRHPQTPSMNNLIGERHET